MGFASQRAALDLCSQPWQSGEQSLKTIKTLYLEKMKTILALVFKWWKGQSIGPSIDQRSLSARWSRCCQSSSNRWR
jgi:hypothetical protein